MVELPLHPNRARPSSFQQPMAYTTIFFGY